MMKSYSPIFSIGSLRACQQQSNSALISTPFWSIFFVFLLIFWNLVVEFLLWGGFILALAQVLHKFWNWESHLGLTSFCSLVLHVNISSLIAIVDFFFFFKEKCAYCLLCSASVEIGEVAILSVVGAILEQVGFL